MYMLSATKERIQLEPIETEVTRDVFTRAATVRTLIDLKRDPVNTPALVARAARTFFEIGRMSGKAPVTELPAGPPPLAFREAHSGLLHVVYHEVVVRFRHGVTKNSRETALRRHGFRVRRVNPFFPNQVIVFDPEGKHAGEELLDAANDLAEMDEVVFAAPNFLSQFQRQAPPSIPAEEWHLRNAGAGGAKAGEDVNILGAWKVTTGKREVVVAVLDDGVDIDHPNLKSRIWRNPDAQSEDKFGRDFFVPENDPDHFNPRPKLFRDPFDQIAGNDIHGTPCAGVIGASGSNGGSVGAAPGCRILAVKVFHADELTAGENVANAIRYASANADILSCSWVCPIIPDIQLALQDAGQIGRQGRGAAVFCAAGNGFGSPVSFPANDPNAIAVGASTDRGNLAAYSNVGPEIAFVAPSSGGERGVFTTDVSIPNRGFNVGREGSGGADGLHTNSFGGTSSATPLASGVAALMLSVNPDLNRSALRNLLASTADKIGTGYDANGHSDQFGHGRINADKAVQAAAGAMEGMKAAAKADKGEAVELVPAAAPTRRARAEAKAVEAKRSFAKKGLGGKKVAKKK